jgi:ribosomal protein L37AE/L43A
VKYLGPGEYEWQGGEPFLRTCPDCNSAHEHLRNTNRVHVCFACGKMWVLGVYIGDLSEEDADTFVKEHQKELNIEE